MKKKLILILFAILSILLITACSKQESIEEIKEQEKNVINSVTKLGIPIPESQILIKEDEAPDYVRNIVSDGEDAVYFQITKFSNYEGIGYLASSKKGKIEDVYFKIIKNIRLELECAELNATRAPNTAVIECKNENKTIRINIDKNSKLSSTVKVITYEK